MRLDGKIAVVTGGASGIGAATSLELARQGADLAICDLSPRESAENVLTAIEALGRRALYFAADVSDRPAMERMITETVDRFGRLDILVNNAGKGIHKPLLDLSITDVETVWNVIVWGAFHCSQLAARQMVQQNGGGNIVMISSVHASRPFLNCSAYDGAKAAVNQMATTWAAELSKNQIRVNIIEPGWIDTPGERASCSVESLQQSGWKIPLGRLGEPVEIAKAVCFLVSDDAAYVTGACLRVDGGFVLPR